MASATKPSKEDLIKQVHQLNWVHTIDLGDGIVTPGTWGNHNQTLWKAFGDIDFGGKKVLDIGCWDGLWSFEAEKRGAAEVYATDLISHRTWQLPTFDLAAQILNSNAKYYPHQSVYDIDQLGINDFDVVIFTGIYYHLKDPLRALCCLRRVMKEGAILLVEGEVIDLDSPHEEEPRRAEASSRGLGHYLRRWLRADSPEPAVPAQPVRKNDCFASFYYRNVLTYDHSNWWVPTIPCLRQWVECNFFEIEREYDKSGGSMKGHARCVLTARAVRRRDPLYIRQDDDLRPFDLNDY